MMEHLKSTDEYANAATYIRAEGKAVNVILVMRPNVTSTTFDYFLDKT